MDFEHAVSMIKNEIKNMSKIVDAMEEALEPYKNPDVPGKYSTPELNKLADFVSAIREQADHVASLECSYQKSEGVLNASK